MLRIENVGEAKITGQVFARDLPDIFLRDSSLPITVLIYSHFSDRSINNTRKLEGSYEVPVCCSWGISLPIVCELYFLAFL